MSEKIHNYCLNSTLDTIAKNTLVSLGGNQDMNSIEPWIYGKKLYGITLEEILSGEFGLIQHSGYVFIPESNSSYGLSPESNLLSENQFSIETDISEFTPYQSVIVQSSVEHYFGNNSILLTCNSGKSFGSFDSTFKPCQINTSYVASAFIKGIAGLTGQIEILSTNEALTSITNVPISFTLTGEWQRVSTTLTTNSQATKIRMTLLINGENNNLYCDGLILELGTTPTVFSEEIPSNSPVELNNSGNIIPYTSGDIIGYTFGNNIVNNKRQIKLI